MSPPRSSRERLDAAYKAMADMGVPRRTVEPVLKRLLKLFDNKWEYIEADNFHALADAIFDVPDPKENEKRKAELKDPEQEDDNKKLKIEGQCQKPKSEMLDNNRRKLSCAPLEQKTRLLSPDTVSREKMGQNPMQSSSGLSTWEAKIEPGDVQVTGIGENVQPFETPVAVMYPPILDSSPNEDLQKPPGYGYSSDRRDSSTSFEVAMPGSGAVKLSFTCSSSLANRSDFHMPDIRSICKEMEARCLRTYKTLEPNFSFMNILRDICHCIVDLGSESVRTRKENNLMRLDGTCSASATAGGSQNSSSNMIVRHQLPIDFNKPPHDLTDIAKGEESVKIPIVSGAGNEKLPPSFYYIPHNITFQDAYINLSLARIGDENCCSSCFGDCLASPIPCACATETGGEFAYTRDGLVKEGFLDACVSMLQEPNKHYQFYCKVCPIERAENKKNPGPCKGHLIKKFIKECWSKCGCSRQCGNRVVQRGITHNLQVFVTPEGKGWGLRTVEKLPRGAFICEYVGEILTNTELYDRTIKKTGQARHTYPVLLDADWATEGVLEDEEALCLDATFYGNVARFINHRCFDANVIGIPVEVETPDHHYYHLAFFTIRQIEPFEELTWDYGIDFSDVDHPIKAFKCSCRSEYCRDRSRISRSKSRALVIG